MDSNTGKSLLPGLAPLLANPTTLTVLGIGAAGWVILKWLFEDDEDDSEPTPPNGSEPSLEPLEAGLSTVENPLGVRDAPPLRAVEPGGGPEVGQPLEEAPDTLGEPLATLGREEGDMDKSELIRQAMSELGKRSAAARARRKQDALHLRRD